MSAEKKSKRTFWTDWLRKLFALVVASVSVFFIYSNVNSNMDVANVKVTFREENPGKVCLIGDIDKRITASFKVDSTRILRNMASYYEIVVTLPNINLPDRKFMYSLDNASYRVNKSWLLPKPVNGSMVFSEKAVPLDVYIDKLVRVRVPEINALRQEGYSVQKELGGEWVYLHGPSESLRKIQEVNTVPLDLAELDGDRTVSLALLPPAQPDVVIKDKVKYVNVNVRLIKSDALEVTTFKGLPLMVLQPIHEVYRIADRNLPTVTVEVRAWKRVLDKHKDMLPAVYINLNEAPGPGVWQAQVRVANVPDNDRMEMTLTPPYVELTLEELPPEKIPKVLSVEELSTAGGQPQGEARPETQPAPVTPPAPAANAAVAVPAAPAPAANQPTQPEVERKPAEPSREKGENP